MTKVLGLLGLAKKAGRIVSGESSCKEAIRYGSSRLVILAKDVSSNTFKNITDSCKYYGIPYYSLFDKETLGNAIGNNFNAVVSVNDEGFAKGILKHIEANNEER